MAKKTDTSQLISYYKAALEAKKVPMPKASRGGPHVRTAIDGDFEKILKSIAKVKIEMMDTSISGSFPTYEITTLEKIGGIPKGTKCLYVNSKSSKGTVTDKEFTPDNLGFAGNRYTASKLESALYDAVRNHPKYNKVGKFMESMIESSSSNSSKLEFGDSVTSTDISKIAKDFGELTGALWLMKTTYKQSKVFFPSASNEPLIDYIIERKPVNINVSAKAGKGAPPSINVVADKLKSGDIKLNSAEKKYAQIIIDIADNSTIEGILQASKTFKTPGYVAVKKIIGDVTRDNINKYLDQYNKWDLVNKELSPFFKTMGRTVSDMMGERIYNKSWKNKKDGIIISPLGYHLVDELNKQTGLTKLLNKVLSSLAVEQLYLNTNGKKITYNLVPFSEGKFLFHYNANAGNPSLKKISFKMKV